jgi:hypothetical protein
LDTLKAVGSSETVEVDGIEQGKYYNDKDCTEKRVEYVNSEGDEKGTLAVVLGKRLALFEG